MMIGPLAEPTVYGLRCGELGDAPGEIHDFILASDYEALINAIKIHLGDDACDPWTIAHLRDILSVRGLEL